jgi:hypothetical protein
MRLSQLPVMAWIRNDLSLAGSRPKGGIDRGKCVDLSGFSLSSGFGISRSFVAANGKASTAGGCGLGIVLHQQDVSLCPVCRDRGGQFS